MKYVCKVCGFVYDEEVEGVKFEDLPEDYLLKQMLIYMLQKFIILMVCIICIIAHKTKMEFVEVV